MSNEYLHRLWNEIVYARVSLDKKVKVSTDDLEKALEQMKELEEALKFYANEDNYDFNLWHDEYGTLIDSEIMDDEGVRATQALKGECDV